MTHRFLLHVAMALGSVSGLAAYQVLKQPEVLYSLFGLTRFCDGHTWLKADPDQQRALCEALARDYSGFSAGWFRGELNRYFRGPDRRARDQRIWYAVRHLVDMERVRQAYSGP